MVRCASPEFRCSSSGCSRAGCGVRLGFCDRPMRGRRPRSIFRWSSAGLARCGRARRCGFHVKRGSVCRLRSLQHAGGFLVSRGHPIEAGGRNSSGAVRLIRGPSRCTNTQGRRFDPCELCLRLTAREMRGRGESGQRASLRLRRDSQLSPWVIQGRFSAYPRTAPPLGSCHCPVRLPPLPVRLDLASRRGGDAFGTEVGRSASTS